MQFFRSQAKLELDISSGTPEGGSGFTDEDGVLKRVTHTLKGEGGDKKLPVFMGPEDIHGVVAIQTPPGKSIEHLGIKVELIGIIELVYDRSATHEFVSVVRELQEPGSVTTACRLPFEFNGVEKQHESYHGINARLRYILRVTMSRKYGNQVKEQEIWVHNELDLPEINHSIKMEVGIEECLHIEFEYNKSKYHLKDIVLGKIYFLLVRIKIKHMELAIIRREQSGSAPNVLNESETLTKFEIMDGAPVRGESIPVRLFMSSFPLTPTMRNVEGKFSVRYYLNLVLVDQEDRRYFKQQEIILWRQVANT
jgi:vacuolar protein sorting-associated protein 26